jgi:hypothetical protein
MRTLRQTFVLAPATKVAVDRSVVQPTTNYIYVIKSTNVYYPKITPKELGPPVTKPEFEKALNELKSKKHME